MSFENFFGEAEFNYEAEKQKFIDNMDFLKEMSVQEQTLYKKWQEFNKDEKLISQITSLDVIYCRKAKAFSPLTNTSPMCETSNTPTDVLTVLCSAFTPSYCTGI